MALQGKGGHGLGPPDPIPEIFFGGASSIAEEVAARHVDVYLRWGEPPPMARERIERVREKAEAPAGRSASVSACMSSRGTTSERPGPRRVGCSTIDPALIDAAQQLLGKASPWASSACCRCTAEPDDLEVSPNLWAGIGLVRPGAGTALVGSHEQVAERILEYHELGIEEFILSGHPHLERPTPSAKACSLWFRVRNGPPSEPGFMHRRGVYAGRIAGLGPLKEEQV